MELGHVYDRFAIEDLLTRYTRAIDTNNWDLLDQVFTPDAHIDYTASGGIAGSFPQVKAWLAKMLPIFPARMHLLGQKEVTIDGEHAQVAAYFYNPMTLPDGEGKATVVEVGGIYHHELIRTAAGWRSRQLWEEKTWSRGF